MQSPIYLLSSVAALCALWLVWTLGFKSFLLDLMRERLFLLRFELFRLGMSGELSFDSDAYRSMETLLCGLLRFGHRITFMVYILFMVEVGRAREEKDYVDVLQQIDLKISRLEPAIQAKLVRILKGAGWAVLTYMTSSSLIFRVFIRATDAVIKILKMLGLRHTQASRYMISRLIEREAYLAECREAA